MADMKVHVQKALNAKKYLLVWDRVGSSTAYFKAMELLLDVGKM
jgi:hypothetical protein